MNPSRTTSSYARYRRLAAVDAQWFGLLVQAGLSVHRDSTCFVAYDGAGNLTIAPDADFDEDDTVAALVLHEICHHAVRGDAGRYQRDWGLTYASAADTSDEHAALRLQRWLAESVGLGELLHPTTVHRAYYEALDGLALDEHVALGRFAASEAEVVVMAARGQRWLLSRPWNSRLNATLRHTAQASRGA